MPKQIQAMLQVFKAVVNKVVREINVVEKRISEGCVPCFGGIVHQPRAAKAIMEAMLYKSVVRRHVVVVKGWAKAAR